MCYLLAVGCCATVVSLGIWSETENEEPENRGNWNLEFRDCGVGTGRVDGWHNAGISHNLP